MDIRSALWFRPASFCLVVLLLCVAIPLLEPYLPDWLGKLLPHVAHDTVLTLLQVLAGSMLTVTTVTLSVLMLSLGLAVSHATPRAVPELMADPVTQSALGTFLASFVFSLGSLFMFGIDAVGDRTAAIVYIVALLLVAASVVFLMQWIHHVAGAIRINKVVERIHRQSLHVLKANFSDRPDASDGQARDEDARRDIAARGGWTVQPPMAGYVQLIDLQALAQACDQHSLRLELCVHEGAFVLPHAPIMRVTAGARDDRLAEQLASTLVIGPERSPASDPLLGFELLAEVACRALSPGINDPQTALVCIGYLQHLLLEAATVPPDLYPRPEVCDGRVRLQRPGFDAMLERAYRPVMRDGAAFVEVLSAVVEALEAIGRYGQAAYRDLLREEARRALDFGVAHLHYEADKRSLRDRVERVGA